MSAEQRLDVVVVAYESAASLSACLSRLPRQASVVVVDNGSSDRSADVAQLLGARIVRNTENRGFAAGANQGARCGTRELLLFLNPDAVVDSAAVAKLVRALDDDPEVAAVGPRLLRPDGSEQRNWWEFPSPWATWAEALGLKRLRPARPGPRGDVPFVTGACLLVRREAFDRVGGFDERFWLYGEEADLCLRLWRLGLRVRYVPEAVAHHVGGASCRDSALVFEHFHRGAEHFVAKHHGSGALVLHRLGLLVGSSLRLPIRRRGRLAARLLRVLVTRPGRVA